MLLLKLSDRYYVSRDLYYVSGRWEMHLKRNLVTLKSQNRSLLKNNGLLTIAFFNIFVFL